MFVDAPGTGFSRPVGKATIRNFAGTDQDVQAFLKFIERYVGVNHRWNSPKFLYGESYGTTRSAALADALENDGVALNGVILMSTILNYFTHGARQRRHFHRQSAVVRGHRLALREGSAQGQGPDGFPERSARLCPRPLRGSAGARAQPSARRRRMRSRPSWRDTPGSASSSSRRPI